MPDKFQPPTVTSLFGWNTGEYEADVAQITIGGSHIVGQLSELPNRDGFLIRVWPPNGTHEHGGTNGTALSLVLRFDGDKPVLESFNYDDRVWPKPSLACTSTPEEER